VPDTFMVAISKEEGFGSPENRATRNNNPGNLNMEPWLTAFGAALETIPEGFNETPRFACFPNADAGWSAMRELLTRDYLGMNVAVALNKWAPPTDGNDTSVYTEAICRWCNVTAETILTAELIG
jgi:hypothetical protein